MSETEVVQFALAQDLAIGVTVLATAGMAVAAYQLVRRHPDRWQTVTRSLLSLLVLPLFQGMAEHVVVQPLPEDSHFILPVVFEAKRTTRHVRLLIGLELEHDTDHIEWPGPLPWHEARWA